MSAQISGIRIVKKGITDFKADCIVNAANEGLWEGGGVCGAIFRAAGSHELTLACQKIGGCPTGSAVITPAFNLNAKYIIHAVGPMYVDGKHNEPSLLYDCYKKSLELAKEYRCRSIVFPLISAGIFGYPAEGAWRRAIRACADFITRNPEYQIEISFAVLNDHMAALGEKTLKEISAESGGTVDASATKVRHKTYATAEDRIKVFQDTQNWIRSDPDLAAAVTAAKKKTTVYYEDDYPAFDTANIKPQRVTVSMDRSYEAAMRIAREDPKAKIAVMNFANAFHPGGGVVNGAGAQEESLCRCSTLYPLLYRRSLRDAFYNYHADRNSPKASDTMMYTEGVVICKTDTEFPERMPKEDWVTVDVMTIAAPDLRRKSNKYAALVDGGTYMNKAELFGYHVRRAIHMLTVAASQKAEVLILGAFGCGAFENDPEVVARAYKTALREFPKVFARVEFAVYCSPKDTTNYDVFRRVLTDSAG